MTHGAEIFQMIPQFEGERRTPGVTATREQLDRILNSKTFQRARRLRSLLQYVVTAATNGHPCGERMTARELFGKGEDFDASLDPVIRVQFGRLRRALTTYYSAEGQKDPIVITIPTRKYAPVFEEADSISGLGNDGGDVGEGNGDCDGHASRPVIAVLPFTNLTNDPSQDSFCQGLAEEIANGLTAGECIDVVANSSTFQYKDEAIDVRQVGTDLGVPLILKGSVRMEEGHTRVIAQLARCSDGVAVWSGSFDDEFNGSLDTQKNIAQKVMDTMPLSSAAVQLASKLEKVDAGYV